MYTIIRLFFLFVYKIIYSLKFEGTDNIPKNGGNIFVSNHRSNADPVLLTLPVPKRFAYMAKKELFRNPFARFIITSMGAFPVERGKGDMAVIDIAVDRLNSGKNFMMFPEGARSKDGKVGKGKSGIAYIAAKSGKNVVPVGIIFEGKLKFRKKVIVRFGKPILAENFQLSDPPQKSELREIISVIMQEIENLVYQNENHVN